jgi:hypothetical protein
MVGPVLGWIHPGSIPRFSLGHPGLPFLLLPFSWRLFYHRVTRIQSISGLKAERRKWTDRIRSYLLFQVAPVTIAKTKAPIRCYKGEQAMKKILICLPLIFSWGLFAAEPATNSQPREVTWRYINYRFPKPFEQWDGSPSFSVTSGEQWGQVSRGLRVDIMNIKEGFAFLKTNPVVACLYRPNGDIVQPTKEGKTILNAPISVSTASFAGEEPNPQVMTYFPWGTNTLEESWIEVSVGPERYWLEIPYGLDRNPAEPPPATIPGGPPRFVSAMNSLTEHDHVVRWENVHYPIGRTPDGRELTLIQSNPFDATSDVDLYRDSKNQDLYSPQTGVRLVRPDGSVSEGKCVNLHLDDNHLRRTDTFDLFDRGADDLRCWEQIEIKIADETYRVGVPSSLCKYVHGHAYKPAAVDFISHLRPGMTLSEAERSLKNYNVSQKSAQTAGTTRQREYSFKPDDGEIMLRFDESDRLVSWKGGSK